MGSASKQDRVYIGRDRRGGNVRPLRQNEHLISILNVETQTVAWPVTDSGCGVKSPTPCSVG